MAALAYLRAGGEVWAAVAYFSLWAVRLTGIFPELRVSERIGGDRRGDVADSR